MAGAALKALVIVMALMILAGMTLVGAIMVGRLARHPAATPRQTAAAPRPQPAFAAPAIDLPAGARVARMSLGKGRLVLDIALPDGNHELLVIDLATGRQLGTIPLKVAR